MTFLGKPSGHHARHLNGTIWLRSGSDFKAISRDRARMLVVHYRALAIKHERSEPVFSEYCGAVFDDLHGALTELRCEAQAELRRAA